MVVDWQKVARDLEAENERLKKQVAYYRRDNDRLNNALAFEHNESDNAVDAEKYRQMLIDKARGE